jgi:hypothetical protein
MADPILEITKFLEETVVLLKQLDRSAILHEPEAS